MLDLPFTIYMNSILVGLWIEVVRPMPCSWMLSSGTMVRHSNCLPLSSIVHPLEALWDLLGRKRRNREMIMLS